MTKSISVVYLRVYEELNDYLPEENHKVWFEYSFAGSSTLMEVFNFLNIPPDEIDLILVNQKSVGFDYVLQNGDMISVYPVFELFNLSGVSEIREKPLRNPVFICDVHLGRLCKYLRMLGWDTLYSNRYTPDELITISSQDNRIILTRNHQLSRHKKVTRAYWIRSSDPMEQIKDVLLKMDLARECNPLTRCLNCNQFLEPIEKEIILHRLQSRTTQYYNEFFICPDCDQIYWKGSHFEHMVDFVGSIT